MAWVPIAMAAVQGIAAISSAKGQAKALNQEANQIQNVADQKSEIAESKSFQETGTMTAKAWGGGLGGSQSFQRIITKNKLNSADDISNILFSAGYAANVKRTQGKNLRKAATMKALIGVGTAVAGGMMGGPSNLDKFKAGRGAREASKISSHGVGSNFDGSLLI
jgi:hypothetical protein